MAQCHRRRKNKWKIENVIQNIHFCVEAVHLTHSSSVWSVSARAHRTRPVAHSGEALNGRSVAAAIKLRIFINNDERTSYIVHNNVCKKSKRVMIDDFQFLSFLFIHFFVFVSIFKWASVCYHYHSGGTITNLLDGEFKLQPPNGIRPTNSGSLYTTQIHLTWICTNWCSIHLNESFCSFWCENSNFNWFDSVR